MNKEFIYEEQKQLIEMWKNKYYEQKQKLEQLENNRDKAIEYINEMSGYDVEDYIRQDLLLILKGDSDENIG